MSDPVTRRRILVDKKFQLQYLYIWLWVGVGMVVMSLLFYLIGDRVLGDKSRDPAVVKLMSGMSGFLVLFCVLMGILSVFLTHRVAGAAYRLEKCIRDLTDGDYEKRISLRADDYLQNIADALNDLQSTMKSQFSRRRELGAKIEELRDALDRAGKLGDGERALLNDTAALLKAVPVAAPVDIKRPPAV